MSRHDDAPRAANGFEYRELKDGRVFILWNGRQVVALAGKKAEKFMGSIGDLDAEGRQLLMARVTGNFKRGNERRDPR